MIPDEDDDIPECSSPPCYLPEFERASRSPEKPAKAPAKPASDPGPASSPKGIEEE